MAGLATSGTLTHWFRDNSPRELDPAHGDVARSPPRRRQSPPGANGLVVLPYFSGERTPIHDPEAKGVLFGLNLTHTRGDIYRALLEGIACGTNHIIETYREAGQNPRAILAVGGGTNNRVWAQATSDISGLTQIVREKTIGASLWRCVPGRARGRRCRLGLIRQWNPVASDFIADAANAEVYRRRYHVFKELYPKTRDLMKRLHP